MVRWGWGGVAGVAQFTTGHDQSQYGITDSVIVI